MANNPQFSGGPGPPLHPPVIGSVGPPQNLPPAMPTQFRNVASVHPPHQFAPSLSQQYQAVGTSIPAMNMGIPPPQTQQRQYAQPIEQGPARPMAQGHLPPMSQSMPLSNIQLNRPISSGLPQPVQNMQAPSSFVPTCGGPGMSLPPAYAAQPGTYPASHYQPVTQVNLQKNHASGPPLLASGNQGAASVTPVHLDDPASASALANLAVDSQPKPVETSSSDWLEHTNNGRRFYYNKRTRKSTWEKPLELMTLNERADATTDWKEFLSLDGRKYYYNKVTKQSKWTLPEELKLVREKAANQSAEVAGNSNASISASLPDNKVPSNASAKTSTPEKLPNQVTTTAVAGSIPSPVSQSALASMPLREPGVQKDAVEVQPPAETLSTTAVGSAVSENADMLDAPVEPTTLPMNESDAHLVDEVLDSPKNIAAQDAEDTNKSIGGLATTNITTIEEKPIERETLAYASKQEAKDAFKSLLESANVESDWTWEQAMRLIINDKRYAALKSLGERKQAFNEYLNQKKKQDAEERRAKNKKAKEEFRKMLEECSELTSTTRWGKAVNLFGEDERFKAIERGRDRQDMFEDFLVELEKKELAKAEEERQQNITEYRTFLESCDFIKANSQWRRVKDRLEADQRCSRLETIDRLKIFQEYVGDLEKEEEEQRRLQREEIRKTERKNRDEFRKLMEGHVADGTLTAKIYWRDYHSKVKDLPAYLAVSSNSSGSTPKELFDDVAEELKKKYQEDKTRIKDAVKSEKVALSSMWTLDDFKAAIANEICSPEVSEGNIKLVFDELIERAREKEEKEAKRRKRLGDEFFNILCSLKDITVDSKWEECLPLFETIEEFRSIGDESFSKQIFEEYLVQLIEKDEERKRKEEKARKERERERERRSKDRREKERRHDKDRGKERSKKEGDDESDYNEVSVSSENRKSGRDKDKKRRKRHHDEENGANLEKNVKDHSRSSHRHSSERRKIRQVEPYADMPESDDESKHKKHKREHRNGSHKKGDNEELEDGELGNW